jgi:hypothetical protein
MIDINKQYKTRNGHPVRILCTDRKTDIFTVVGLIYLADAEVTSEWTAKGSHWATEELNDLDLIEVSPYEDFKVDDLCVVWSSKSKFFRYFCKVENNIAYCFNAGTTSYTAATAVNHWENCRKATPEEIATKSIQD